MKVLIQCSTKSHTLTAEAVIKELNRIEKNEILVLSLAKYYGYGPDEYVKSELRWPLYIFSRIRKKPKNFNILDYIQFIIQYRSILKSYKPDILLLGDDHPPLQVAMIEESKRKNIPSILIQEGPFTPSMILNEINSYQNKNNKKSYINRIKSIIFQFPRSLGYGHGNSTVFAVMSEYYRNLWEKAGISPNSIKVTGQPRYDRLFLIKKLERNSQYISKNNILILSQPLTKYGNWKMNEYRHLIKLFNDAAKELYPDFKFNIRLHPSESMEDYSLWWNEICTHLNFLSPNDDLYNQILNSCIIITIFSTAAFEAAILGRPIITVRDIKKQPAIWDTIPDVSINVNTAKELVDIISRIAKDRVLLEKIQEAQEKLIQQELVPFDGKSSYRVARLIYSFKK